MHIPLKPNTYTLKKHFIKTFGTPNIEAFKNDIIYILKYCILTLYKTSRYIRHNF